jgi:hypothetical protein
MAVPQLADLLRDAFLGEGGAAGRAVLSCGLFGGIAAGGILMAVMTWSGRINPGFHLLVAPVVFILGTIFGVVEGGVLALVARPRGTSIGCCARRTAVGLLVLLVLLPLSWLVSSAITVGVALVVEVRPSLVVVTSGGLLVGLAVSMWAMIEHVGLLRATWVRLTAPRDDGVQPVGLP